MEDFIKDWKEAKEFMYEDAFQAVEDCKSKLNELTESDLERLALLIYKEGTEHGWEACEDQYEYDRWQRMKALRCEF